MKSSRNRVAGPHGWTAARLLGTAFVLIGMLFALTMVPALLKAREVEERTGEIVSNAIASITLVSRMSRDVDRKRLLVDAHIFESDAPGMQEVERRMAEVDADLAQSMAAYEPLATLPDERATYERLRAEVDGIQPAVGSALALSRRNEDRDARRALAPIEARFGTIDEELEQLVRINERGAAGSYHRILDLQRSGALTLGVLALAGVALTAIVGVFATRMAARRDALARRYSLALERQNEELYAFAGRVAHDLRRPLGTAVLALAALDRSPPDQRERARQTLDRSLNGMATLIDDLLNLSRLDGERKEATCDPRALVATVLEEIRPPLERDGGTVHVDVEEASVRCAGEGLLRQALWNLVENAVKYCGRGRALRLEVQGRVGGGDRYRLELRDDGPGMSEADAARAFEPLYRGVSSRDVPGTGLGLSIVKRVVEASGGAVSVRSRTGAGTTFVIELPLAEARRELG